MKQHGKVKAKLLNLAMLTLIVLAQITSPVLSIAETIDSQSKTEQVGNSVEQKEVETSTEEPPAPVTKQSSVESDDVEDPESSSESANANDSPRDDSNVEENQLSDNASDNSDEIDIEKIEQLANRVFPEKYDTSGLTDSEIELLGIKIFGEYQPFGASVTMKNDEGVDVNIPFKFMRQTREIGSKRAFNMPYVLTGFGTTSRYPTISHHYLDSRYAYCMDPNTLFVEGANYGPQPMDITNQTYKNINDVLNFGAADDSDDIASGYTQLLVWSRLGWDVTEVGGIGSLAGFQAYQAQVEAKIQQWYKPASFDGQTVTLKIGESKTLTDTNNSLNAMVIDANTTGTTVTKNGNQLTIRASSNTNTDGTIVMSKENQYSETALIWTSPGSQSVATPGKMDPAFTSTKVNVKIINNGTFRIQKLDDDTNAPLANAVFKVEAGGVTKNYTTGANGLTPEIEVPDGTKVKATEISIPKPYILSSALGGSDVVEGTVKANEILTLTKRNKKQTGQIIVEKVGQESGTNMWNGNYLLTGTSFEFRKDSPTGAVVETATANALGAAKSSKNLPLGTYYVVEKQAGAGFVNTFKPVKVELTYGGQTTAVVVGNAKGTNQEVTGSNTLTKEDAETGSQTQGRASFKGAEYSLYHVDGTPVKWSENFKPVLSHGTKLSGDNIVIKIDDNQKAGVKHLALGEYYWLETKAPEGYQLDPNKHSFKLTYKDQNTEVISTTSTSKEKVIKFNFEGFKYVTSTSGSTVSGFNGLKFRLTPIDPTKGEVRETISKTDANGYDGAWGYKDVPYGDYEMTEVEAPEGYELIKPLIVNSSFDEATRNYTFKITEKGSKEPLKVLTVAEKDIHSGSNVISLGKLYLYNNHAEVPEEPEMESKFLTANGESDFDLTVDQTFTETLKTKFDKLDVEKTFYYVSQFHKVKLDGTSEVIGTEESEHTIDKRNLTFKVNFDYKANMLLPGEKIVATQIIYEDAAHTKEYARHFDLENEDQTLLAVENDKPEIETLFITTEGEKDFDPTVDQVLKDKVNNTFAKRDVGKTFYWTTNFHKLKLDGTSEIVGTVESEQPVEKEKFTFNVDFNYTAGLLKHGEKLVATHILYTDAERENEYTRHFDLENEDQTLLAKENDKPLIETLFVTTDGETKFDPTKDQKLIDQVSNEYAKRDLNKTFYYVTQFHKIDAEGKDTVVGTVESEHKIEKMKFEFDVEFDYKANTLLHGEKLVATHKVYTDKEHKDEYAEHFDLTNRKQTLEAVNPELPSIETLFVTKDGKKEFDPTKDQALVDKVKATVPIQDVNKVFYYVTEFHKIDIYGNETVIGRDESERKATDLAFEFEAIFNYKANMLKDGERLVATHKAYHDKEHKNEYASHFDLSNLKQTLTAKTPETKVTTPTSKPTTPTVTRSLPQTNGSIGSDTMLLILAAMLIVTAVVGYYQKKHKKELED